MRIALVAHHARPTGGQDRYVLELARELSGRHDVHLIVVRAEGLGDAVVTVHTVPVLERPVIWLAPRFAARATDVARRGAFDIVHAIGGAAPGANVITAQYCQQQWRAVVRSHGTEGASAPARLYQAGVMHQAVRYERRAYAHPGLRRVIAVSAGTAGEIARWYGVDMARIKVVHNGVDSARFAADRHPEARALLRTRLGLPHEAPIALFVGTYRRKGLATAIEAVARASGDVHLVVAGTGDAAWARRLARRAGLGDRLHLLGAVADVAPIFAGTDLFVLPTRYEPFGMVIAEAMASGLPVVVPAGAGAAEVIRNGESGCLVDDPYDAATFASAIRELVRSPERAQRMGQAARAAAAPLAWANVARRTEEVYTAALAEGAS